MDPLEIGYVIGVEGDTVDVQISVSDLRLEYHGKTYRIGRLGTYVTIPMERRTLIGYITRVGVAGDLMAWTGRNAHGRVPVGVRMTNIGGSVSVGNVDTHSGKAGTWCNCHAGHVNVAAVGSVETGDITTDFRGTSNGYDCGHVTITSSTGPVTVGGLDTHNPVNNSGSYAGNVTLASYLDLTVKGSVDLGAAYTGGGGSRRGTLDLSTAGGGGGRIYIGDEDTDVLDMNKLYVAMLDSDSDHNQIGGALDNFDTASSGGTGSALDPFLTTQTALRCPAGEEVYYNYVSGGLNDYLGGHAYRVADLAGNPGEGGILAPPPPVGPNIPEPAGLSLLGVALHALRRKRS